ncbi:lipopolysaccharide-induced tumor necrosis factor-alpha factor homolog [Hyposmocoma kahamanoa]|uniref:lipopolysaccharide-induced tumor necrosis factor-alpha factor homolog n=1 Tax=Hyposmocoma kahamanoa TaxID=1477025 RepID=UPI000E6D8102|nr:lipopolysaccharide-induced tumor necrosis factor-alpha factor homolog [Hyposmocoma kahamanoa]
MEEKSGNPLPYSGVPTYPHQQLPPDPVNVVPGGVIVQNPIQPNVVSAIVVSPPVGPKPSHMTCQSCGAEIVTRVEYKPSTKTHLIALALCSLGCWCCVCIPYCKDSCQNADHYCPNCDSYIGVYSS